MLETAASGVRSRASMQSLRPLPAGHGEEEARAPEASTDGPSSSTDRQLNGAQPAGRPINELERAIVGHFRGMNAQCYDTLVLVREFDERRGWARCSSTGCAEWLHWRCDLGLSAAREHVRVAHALKTLPLMSAEFATGRLSYSKVRALTRLAAIDDEAALLDMAKDMTAEHVEQHCRRRRNACESSKHQAVNAHDRRSLRSWRNERRGMVTIMLEVPIEDGALFERAIDKACADQGGSGQAPDDSTPWVALQADAAVAMAKAYLDGMGADGAPGASSSSSTADHYQVTIHVDHDALKGNQGESDLPIETVRRLCCDGGLVPVIENGEGEPLNVGRKQRVVTTAIRRALWARDRQCAFPGCSHTRFVDAHHIRHWIRGGETSLANLVLLCSTHHRLVHEGGYGIGHDHLGKRFFRRPDGSVVPACGYRAEDWQDEMADADPSAEGFFDGAEPFHHAREPIAVYRVRPVRNPTCCKRVAPESSSSISWHAPRGAIKDG